MQKEGKGYRIKKQKRKENEFVSSRQIIRSSRRFRDVVVANFPEYRNNEEDRERKERKVVRRLFADWGGSFLFRVRLIAGIDMPKSTSWS